jgi:uncharacterized protein YvpB
VRRALSVLLTALLPLVVQVAPAGAASPPDNRHHLYTLDGWGGLHPSGDAPSLSTSAYWYHWDIGRGLALFSDGSGGYVLDGWGGLHQVGSAPPMSGSAYWRGWDIARGVVMAPWSSTASPQGWVLDGWGGLHPFGGAPEVRLSAYWNGWDIARGVVVAPDSTPGHATGLVLDGWGGLHAFGNASVPSNPAVSGYWSGWDIAKSITLLPSATASSPAGYVVDGWGGIHEFGGAPAASPSAYWPGWDIARGITSWSAAPAGTPGGWVLDGWGGLHAYGSAPQVANTAYWPGWDIARGSAGPGSGSGTRRLTARTLPVPDYRQAYALSCEAASLQMALAYEGIGTTQGTILNTIGIDYRGHFTDSAGHFRWGDPFTSFVGNPNGDEGSLTGYGTYDSAVAAAASALGGRVSGWGEGVAPDDVYSAILNGHPVVAWIAYDWRYHATTNYQAFDGRWVPFGVPYEHAVTVVGVNESSVLVNNPIGGPQWIGKATFEAAYATFGDMEVTL